MNILQRWKTVEWNVMILLRSSRIVLLEFERREIIQFRDWGLKMSVHDDVYFRKFLSDFLIVTLLQFHFLLSVSLSSYFFTFRFQKITSALKKKTFLFYFSGFNVKSIEILEMKPLKSSRNMKPLLSTFRIIWNRKVTCEKKSLRIAANSSGGI